MPKRRYQPKKPVISETLLANIRDDESRYARAGGSIVTPRSDIDSYVVVNICDRIGPPNLFDKLNARRTKGRAK
jgi:hypothetical protein